MPRLQKDKVQLAFCEVNILGNVTLHCALKTPIYKLHFIVLTSITIRRNPYERIANTKHWFWEVSIPICETNKFTSRTKNE